MNKREKEKLIDMLLEVGGIYGAHHKQWAIDQALRVLMGADYRAWMATSDNWDRDWDQGVAP